MRETMSIVLSFSPGLPPAPYVTETNVGSRVERAARAASRLRAPSSVLGGKNSKENEGSGLAAMRSSIRMALEASFPPLGLALDLPRLATRFEVGQVAEQLGQQPARHLRPEPVAVDRRGEVVGRARPGGERGADRV